MWNTIKTWLSLIWISPTEWHEIWNDPTSFNDDNDPCPHCGKDQLSHDWLQDE